MATLNPPVSPPEDPGWHPEPDHDAADTAPLYPIAAQPPPKGYRYGALLPEVDTYMVGIVAAQLWGSGSEPAPPKPDEGIEPVFRAKPKAEPPQPMLSIPSEAEVVRRPPRPTIPAGAPVNLAGLAELRRREMYDD